MGLRKKLNAALDGLERNEPGARAQLDELIREYPNRVERLLRARAEVDPGRPEDREVVYRVRQTWRGDEGVQEVQPLRLYSPESPDEVQAIVLDAVEFGCRVKAVATGQSYSDMTHTTDFLIDMRDMDDVHYVSPDRLRSPDDAAKYIDVDAGTTVRELNSRLEAAGRALTTMASYDEMTLVGSAMSGSHGSGPRIGEVASQIRSLKLVTGDGRLIRVEPTDGISSPDYDEPGVEELISDDAVFNAAVVGLGCCGVVCSVIIETQPLYQLEEVRTLLPWTEVRAKLESGELLADNHWVELWVNPHEVDGTRTALVTTRNPTTEQPRGGAKRRTLLPEIAAGLPVASDLIVWFLDRFPQHSVGVVESALEALEDESFIGPPGETLIDLLAPNGFANEMFFSLDDGRYLDAIDAYFDLASHYVEFGQRYMNLLAIRFMAPSDAFMAMNQGRRSVSIELPTLTRWRGARDVFDHVQRRMIRFGGRSHWALEFDTLTDAGGLVRSMYPKYEAFNAARRRLDPHDTFANSFTDRIGLTTVEFGGM